MPKEKASAAAWNGTPPVSREGFAFADNEFFAETSNKNRHRRATPAELGTHFAPTHKEDRPGHWYEAQLIHYGLQPSKTKSMARMRLYDAVNADTLKVPEHLAKLETTLKKEWAKNNREAKKVEATTSKKSKTTAPSKTKAAPSSTKTAAASSTKPTSKSVTTSKRKVSKDDEHSASGVTKKAKTDKAASKPNASSQKSTAPSGRTKQTASRGGRGGGRGRGASAARAQRASPPVVAPPRQTARRGGGFLARDIPPGRSVEDHIKLFESARSAIPPYVEEYPYPWSGDMNCQSTDDPTSSPDIDDDPSGDEFSNGYIGRLGLLNGRYHVTSRFVTSEWSFFNGDDFTLGPTLAGTSLWGHFDLGVIEGILYFEDRPWDASDDCVPFIWRGREHEGPIIYGDDNEGWMKFLGDGRIEGGFDMMGITFRGQRSPNQGTRSDVDARSLQDEWDSYTEDKYEQENQNRW